ncbi:MAG: Holliday junction resolvase RuvX [Cytophagales bacterium]|nr:Holliday junction resolvase RuvX [Cytophagales bacterium]MDW8385116.1 Holliday junction resolvase RuvX [Flammeovirgaceae bacterium]
MPRIVAIDYGLKRSGVAVTDPLQLVATALDAVETPNLIEYLKRYLQREEVEAFVIGLPLDLDSKETDASFRARNFAQQLSKEFGKPIHWIDERFTSKIASQVLIASGLPKKKRKVKENIDKISAVIILQNYLENSKK